MDQAARQHVSKYLAYFGPIGALGGFVSDVIQPLAPLSAYVFWVSLAASVGLIVGWLVLRVLRPRLLPPDSDLRRRRAAVPPPPPRPGRRGCGPRIRRASGR